MARVMKPNGPKAFVEWWENHHGTTGSAHSISGDCGPEDRAAQVRQIAEEVSGKEMPKPPARRIGF
jgi:hypothetical protein